MGILQAEISMAKQRHDIEHQHVSRQHTIRCPENLSILSFRFVYCLASEYMQCTQCGNIASFLVCFVNKKWERFMYKKTNFRFFIELYGNGMFCLQLTCIVCDVCDVFIFLVRCDTKEDLYICFLEPNISNVKIRVIRKFHILVLKEFTQGHAL